MTSPAIRAAIVAAVVVVTTVGCSGDDAVPATVPQVPETVGLGVLPDPPTPLAPPPTPPTTTSTTVFVPAAVEAVEGPIGEAVEGNRLLLIGGTTMATLTVRHDGIACPVLPEMGWQVEIEAEMGRFLTFADEVVEAEVVDAGADWDAYGVMFGLQVDTSPEEFGGALDRLIVHFDGRPVMLYTVAERVRPDDDPDEVAVALNEQIRLLDQMHPNVVVVDWAGAVDTETQHPLVDDERVPTVEGMGRLVLLTAAALGESPVPDDGVCLESTFTDDSAILL